MKVTIGKKGLKETWQQEFPETTKCCKCGKQSRIGFVAHETVKVKEGYVCDLHENKGGSDGAYWLHDACCVAVYFCEGCLEPTALYNQA